MDTTVLMYMAIVIALGAVVSLIGSKMMKGKESKFLDEHPDAVLVYHKVINKGVSFPSIMVNSLDEKTQALSTQAGINGGFYLIPGRHELVVQYGYVSYWRKLIGLRSNRVSDNHTLWVEVEAGKEYELILDFKTGTFSFAEK